VGPGDAEFLDATKLATSLMGDSIATNLFMVGYAFQRGRLPLSEAAILKAIELNGTAVESNTRSFEWGRLAAVDPAKVAAAAIEKEVPEWHRPSQTLAEVVERRARFLTDYQDAAYARRYTDLVERVRVREQACVPGATDLADAVARCYFKLLAIKDEYEVARLHTETGFLERIAAQFEGDYTVKYHMAQPLLARPDPATGVPAKIEYGPWLAKAMRVLARMRRFRGTALDVFGRTAERRRERALIGEYETLVDEVLVRLARHNHALAIDLARIPNDIRGYGHVKARHLEAAKRKEAELLARFRGATPGGATPQPIAVAA
jgi:indolepyruvate ferredoxin oxidoreductase